jgi:hypothetical protein
VRAGLLLERHAVLCIPEQMIRSRLILESIYQCNFASSARIRTASPASGRSCR